MAAENDIGKEGGDPYASDAAWIENGGYDIEIDKEVAKQEQKEAK